MTASEMARRRLQSQRIGVDPLGDATGVVRHLVAVQAQDYAGAKWALGVRMTGATDAAIEHAYQAGAILRTHVLRPTWHFVLPDDIRWLLTLTGPRVHQRNGPIYRRLELDLRTLKRAQAVMCRAIADRGALTRGELATVLHRARIDAAGVRLAAVVMAAELDGIICSGPRRGKQFTYALLADRAPHARQLPREEALAELAARYFESRGPATVHDLVKWSGLTVTDARRGLEAARASLAQARVDGVDYFYRPRPLPARRTTPVAHLLSIYDEYVSSYRGHGAIADDLMSRHLRSLGNGLINIVVVDGRVVGSWKREVGGRGLDVRLATPRPLADAQARAVGRAADRLATFLGVPARVVWHRAGKRGGGRP